MNPKNMVKVIDPESCLARLFVWPAFFALAWVLHDGGLNACAQLSSDQSAVLSDIARKQSFKQWPELSQAQAQQLGAKAQAYFSDYQKYHQPYGLTADLIFAGADRDKVVKLEGIGDSATWTGHYLAALAFRYATTKEPQILSDIGRVLDAYEILTRVSGREGHITRFAGRADDPAYQAYYRQYGKGPDPKRPGFGTSAYPGAGKYTNLVWLGNSSRDVYLGVNLGLATTYRLVPDAKIRARVKALVESIVDRLNQDNGFIVDGQKHYTPPTPSMTAALLRTATAVNPQKYQALYNERTALFMAPPRIRRDEEYYPNNLNFITYYVLATLETDTGKKSKYHERLKKMWAESSDHLNAWFAVAYASATGDTTNAVARATLQGVLSEFPEPPRWAKPTDNSTRTEIERIQAGGKSWAKYALPIQERPPSDFMWQRSPFQLKEAGNTLLAYPGIDVFLPYWAARQCGLVPGEDRSASDGKR